MENKFQKIILVLLIITFSCKKPSSQKKIKLGENTELNLINTSKFQQIPKIENKIIDSIINEVKRIEFYGVTDEGQGAKYIKNNKTIWIEVLNEINKGNKIIFYSFKNRLDNQHKFFINKKNSIILIVEEETKYDKIKETAVTLKQDTILFKENKIYFWKNKQATKEELLKKEKEILAIKREIDSIMEW